MGDPVRFFLDEHMDPAVADGVRRLGLGIDILTAGEAGRLGFDDPDQLAFATTEGRVMVTFDTDYLVLHTAGTPHAGIAWGPARKHTIGTIVDALELIHGVFTTADMIDRLEYL